MKIRCYSKQELAMLYFPDAAPHVAVNRLTGWIRRCRPLDAALQQCSRGKCGRCGKYFSKTLRVRAGTEHF